MTTFDADALIAEYGDEDLIAELVQLIAARAGTVAGGEAAVITQAPEQARSSDPELRALGIADADGVTDLRTSLFERLLRVSQRSGWKS